MEEDVMPLAAREREEGNAPTSELPIIEKELRYIKLLEKIQDVALQCDDVDTECLFETFTEFYREGMSDAVIFSTLRDNQPGLRDLSVADEKRLIDILKKWQKKQKFSDAKKYLKFHKTKNGETVFVGIQEKFFAMDLVDAYHFKTLNDTKEILYYGDDGVYHYNGETLIHTECEKVLGHYLNMRNTAEITTHVRGDTYVDRKELNSDSWRLNLKNGLLNTKTFEFIPHTPDLFTTIRIPLDYDENADCPEIKRFLSEIVYENDIPLIEEIIGYCLYHHYPFQNWFLLEGEGANGKSTLLSLIGAFLGEENITAIGLQDLSQRFAPVNLYGKSANIVADLSDADLKKTARLKQLTGGDMIAAEPKFKDGFNYRNFAKLIYSCNRVPITEDKSKAFFRRVVFISFPNEFVGSHADEHLLDKLTTTEELRGLLNVAIQGLKRLLDNGNFTGALTAEEKEELYERASNTVYGFFHDWCEIDVEKYTPKQELYEGYCEYCKVNKVVALSEKKFIQELRLLVRLEESRVNVGKQRLRIWKGIYIKDVQLRIWKGIYIKDVHDVHDVHDFCILKGSFEKKDKDTLNGVLSKEKGGQGGQGGQENSNAKSESTVLTCICGKPFDTIEVLHEHQAKCSVFQAAQDNEAKSELQQPSSALPSLIKSIVIKATEKDERGAMEEALINHVAKHFQFSTEDVEKELEKMLRDGVLMHVSKGFVKLV